MTKTSTNRQFSYLIFRVFLNIYIPLSNIYLYQIYTFIYLYQIYTFAQNTVILALTLPESIVIIEIKS